MSGITDPIADMLTRIRNATKAHKTEVEIPASKMKLNIARILKEEGFIQQYKLIKDGKQGIIKITLKYDENKKSVISGLKRVSKPGRRIYVKKDKLPYVLNGLGIAIISTSKGVMTDKEARKLGIGGEWLCSIW
ncbi:MAG TPA: 30S ribosomal protein S8 [Candidatus Desulfofervidus auxilii]|uniref:Small ribosomal subunit protein uS8 n=1 Tax=Desulfofervidus auxilii TaxID=1621989 RepID=A0A7C0Y411_DESA2|nr:30S ribosomal protein S8 [Candidatus Desulfofervidus auxilii]HDD43957.1 30S ribosomal protein S8 [Candidatus Desulfofervidus auxilii]